MKRRLTVTIDADVLAAAKEYARSRGVPLSSLVEQILSEAVREAEPSFAEKWRGRFQAAHHVNPELLNDPRYVHLARKHLW